MYYAYIDSVSYGNRSLSLKYIGQPVCKILLDRGWKMALPADSNKIKN